MSYFIIETRAGILPELTVREGKRMIGFVQYLPDKNVIRGWGSRQVYDFPLLKTTDEVIIEEMRDIAQFFIDEDRTREEIRQRMKA